jgi:MSHA type pilus biogenesis protein MshL
VGATIRSTGGPQPLWEVLKRLANLKGMTVSWANDVDKNVPVDVDISADEAFFDAIANLLRQADYFHEAKGKSIIVKNKTTKVYQIGVPQMQGAYTSTIGGNFLSNKDAASGTEGTVKVTSADNKFNVWENIESNLKTLLQVAEAERKESVQQQATLLQQSSAGSPQDAASRGVAQAPTNTNQTDQSAPRLANNTARDGSSFVIDKSVGLVTVTAKPNTLKIVDDYIANIKKHLYQQVSIEAKIIEVFLQDNSKIGIDWTSVLKDFNVNAIVGFGNAGQVYPYRSDNTGTYANTFVSRVVIPPLNFNVFLNALNEQGDTHVLANPKLTVLNGQPAIISVGKDIAYVKQVTSEVDSENDTVTYTAEVGNVVQGIALGVMASVREGKKVVLHLTPITTDIENLTANGDVETTTIGEGDNAIQLGLPQVKVREMSTMVEVLDGEMLVIGGLIDSIEGKSESFAPGLGKIPGVKYLFGVEEKKLQRRELVILLTPRLI